MSQVDPLYKPIPACPGAVVVQFVISTQLPLIAKVGKSATVSVLTDPKHSGTSTSSRVNLARFPLSLSN